MKIRFKNKEMALKTNLVQDEYRVVAKEADLGGGYTYVFFNENLQEMSVQDTHVEITDDDMSDMVQRNDLWYGREFYVNELLMNQIELKQGHIISTRTVWLASKAFRYFEEYNYEIPDRSLMKTIR